MILIVDIIDIMIESLRNQLVINLQNGTLSYQLLDEYSKRLEFQKYSKFIFKIPLWELKKYHKFLNLDLN